MKKIFISILYLIFLVFSPTTNADYGNGLVITQTTTSKLEKIYQQYGYEHYIAVQDYHIPQIYLEHFPTDFSTISDFKKRNELFIKILTPLALKINQEIMQERAKMIKLQKTFLQKSSLSVSETNYLEQLAKKYDVFTRLKGKERIELQFNQLELKINQVYPSFLIGISAIETDWGTSRIVYEGNALYKELVWHSTEGLKPDGETEDHTYKIRIFPNLYESMKSFALKFNSNVAYEHARFLRNLRYKAGINPSGRSTVHSMLFQSPLENYIGILDYTITFYKLMLLDQAPLNPNPPKLIKNIKKNK
ncbi:MAG: glucosaminidase domain-containing protein [Alphaproteobacteria bacterium]|nr:glucosaminidase domain-containing protein [Alphaproteobacteria bacterium]